MPRQQRGGAKFTIGELTPDIGSPAALEQKCQFFYVSGHGQTDLRGWFIVPEHTFIIYIGFSGFSTKVAHKAEWLLHAATRNDYFKGMFDTYFHESIENAKSRPYANQHVYIPGDLLPITMINFESGLQNHWEKGVFECPVKDPNVFDVEVPENNLVYVLSTSLDAPGARDVIGIANPRQPEWDTFVSLSNDKKLQFLKDNRDKQKVNVWFEKPSLLNGLTDVIFQSSPENLFKRYYPTQRATTLPTITSMVKGGPKKYKFFIVSSCRPPINFLNEVSNFWQSENKMKEVIGLPNPRNLPEEINARRTLARRASFSAKPLEEVCATTDDPPMNLTHLLAALDDASKVVPMGTKEDAFVKELHEIFYGERDNRRQVQPSISIKHIADLFLNRVFVPYPILTSEDEKKRNAFTRLLQSIQAALGAFMVGVHFDSKADEKRAQLLGRQLLEQAGYPDDERPLNNAEAVLKAQRAFVEDPKWTALRAPRSDLQRMAQKGQIFMIATDLDSSLLPVDDPRRIDYERRKKIYENAKKMKERQNRISRRLRGPPAPAPAPNKTMFSTKMAKKSATRSATRPVTTTVPALANQSTAPRPLWNEKELLKWRTQWLVGERNPKRDEARLKQWAAYRSSLTEEQRNAQNRNLTRRARRDS